MAVTQSLSIQTPIYYQLETSNKSFLDMHYYLKDKGIKHNSFFLALYDTDLIGVNPRDPNLSPQMKIKVLRECMINYYYFLREVIRVPMQGGSASSGDPYKLHRGNLAMNFLFCINFNMFVEMPRQNGKTVAALARYLWCFNFGTTNSEMMFIHKDHGGSKGNLTSLKRLRELLPSYLQMDTAVGFNGKKLKAANTIETLQHPANHNMIKTLASAKTKASANNLGRGCTMPLQYYDEFAFIKYNHIIYNAATPAFSMASSNAERYGSPYGILCTTTPGDLQTEEGMYAYEFKNRATPWDESYYDLTGEQLLELKNANENSKFFYIRYTYKQLGRDEQYFRDMVIDLQQDWANIRREVLLEWAKTATNCPFKYEDLEIISQYIKEPIRVIPFGRCNQYLFQIYEDIDMRYPPIIGVDVSGSMYQDASAITVLDSKSTKVCACLNCNFMPTDDLAEVLYVLVTNYMPNAVVNIERNGGFGASVIQRLMKTSIKKNLYYEIKDKTFEERVNGTTLNKMSGKYKIFGLDSTREIRARLIELLYERVQYHKDKFISPILLDEMQAMEVKKNGKVEHSNTSHDDQVFSYLMALYVWYDGINLTERFNIIKNTIKTDESLEEAITSLEDLDGGYESVDISTEITDNLNPILKDQLEFIEDAQKVKVYSNINQDQDVDDERALKQILTSKDGMSAYNKANHFEDGVPTLNGNYDTGRITIPNSVFDEFNDDGIHEYNNYQGNLGDIFSKL